MTKIIAAVDNSATAGPVLATARSLARLFDATVEAVHVREDGEGMVRAAAVAVIKPWQCKVFGTACTPEQPIGTCMVSSEGACAAYYNYGRFRRRLETVPA